MSIELAEQLKRDLTDKWVLVDKTIPELKRFSGLTGKVKTVNMNARALVEFDGGEDIGWYDIDPSFLTVVDGPVKKEKAAAPAKAEKKPAAAKPAGGGSPLDAIRKQGAGGGAAEKKASPLDAIRAAGAGGADKPKPAAGGGSPLDQIRAQGAGGAAATTEESPAEKPAAAPTKPAAGGSPLDMIRSQGAVGSGGGAAAPAEEAPTEEPAAEEAPATAEEATPEPEEEAAPAQDLSGLSPIEQIRAQGAFKG